MATELDVRRRGGAGLLLAALSITCAAIPATAGAQLFSAKEMRGRVLDRETGDPLENAVVVALWLLTPTGGLSFEPYDGRLQILETLTDEKGEWTIRGWGPKRIPLFRKVSETMPWVGAYSPGHAQEWVQGQREIAAPNALDLRLRRVTDIEERSRQALYFFMTLSSATDRQERDEWPSFPRTTVIMMREAEWLKANGAKHFGPSVPQREDLSPQDRALLERTEREVPR